MWVGTGPNEGVGNGVIALGTYVLMFWAAVLSFLIAFGWFTIFTKALEQLR